MRKRTTLILDTAVLQQAQQEFGTRGTTETVHRALEEALAFRSRLRLTQLDLPDLTPESLEAFRSNRVFPELAESLESEQRQPA